MGWPSCCAKFTLLLCFFTGSSVRAEDAFKFVSSESDFRFFEVEIQPGLPEGFDEATLKSSEPNTSTEFSWFRYGDDASRAICLRFDTSDAATIFVDADRDQKFTTSEKHTATQTEHGFMGTQRGQLSPRTRCLKLTPGSIRNWRAKKRSSFRSNLRKKLPCASFNCGRRLLVS